MGIAGAPTRSDAPFSILAREAREMPTRRGSSVCVRHAQSNVGATASVAVGLCSLLLRHGGGLPTAGLRWSVRGCSYPRTLESLSQGALFHTLSLNLPCNHTRSGGSLATGLGRSCLIEAVQDIETAWEEDNLVVRGISIIRAALCLMLRSRAIGGTTPIRLCGKPFRNLTVKPVRAGALF
jgi:hypothetical protein